MKELSINIEYDNQIMNDHLDQLFPPSPFIERKVGTTSTFALNGDEIGSFIYFTLGSAVLTNSVYDILKSYFKDSLIYIRRTLNKEKGMRITINGITFKIKSEKDVELVLETIIENLELMKEEENGQAQ